MKCALIVYQYSQKTPDAKYTCGQILNCLKVEMRKNFKSPKSRISAGFLGFFRHFVIKNRKKQTDIKL